LKKLTRIVLQHTKHSSCNSGTQPIFAIKLKYTMN
jgi:hypothetical protein